MDPRVKFPKNKNQYNDINGLLLVNKPAGPTSHDIVDFIRKKFKIKKVGHAGTLDPFADGLLIILLGKATKSQSEYMSKDKTYEVDVRLGLSTDTGDNKGRIISEFKGPLPRKIDIENILPDFMGELEQEAPMYSAIKFKGKPLYKFARKNISIVLPKRKIRITEVKILEYSKPILRLLINCSKGTYIRQLCLDIGAKLGCGAHAVTLKRTASGAFDLSRSISLNDLKLLNPDDLKKMIINLDEKTK